jgi:hypothetical protein
MTEKQYLFWALAWLAVTAFSTYRVVWWVLQ